MSSSDDGDDDSIMSVSDSGSEVDEGQIMNLLSNPYSSLEDEEDIPDIEIPIATATTTTTTNGGNDKGKEEEEEESSLSEEEEEEEVVVMVPIEAPLFATPMDQYACYAYMIYCFYFYLCTGELFRMDAIEVDLKKLTQEQSEAIREIASLAGAYETRTQKTKTIVETRLIGLCQAKDNSKAAALVKAISSAALFQKSKVATDSDRCIISGEEAAFTLSVVSKADGEAATAAGKKSVNWTMQVPVSASWATVLQSFYLLGHLTHLLNSEIPRHCSKIEGIPMAKGETAIAYMEEHLLNMPFFQFKNADRRLVVKKNQSGAYVYGQIKKQCKPITLLAMETSLRLSILMHGLRNILTEEQLTP